MKIAIIDELHDIKRSGVYYSTEALKDMLRNNGIECSIIGINRRGRIFNKLICLPFIRECFIFPIWNCFMVQKLQRRGYEVVFYQCSTSIALIRKAAYRKTIYTRSILSRQLDVYKTLDLQPWQKVASYILHPLVKTVEGMSFRNADRIIASKQRLADYLGEKFRIEASRFRTVPQMIDIPKQNITKREKVYDLLFIGRLSVPKNWDMVVSIARNTSYKIAAATPEYEMPDGLPENITVRQRVPYAKLGDLINSSRVFIMPSHKEEGPRVTLEAMSFGMPVVASIEGSGGFIEEGVNGIVVDTNDVDKYIAAIDELLGLGTKALKVMSEHNQAKALSYQPAVLGPQYIDALTF